MPAAWDHRSWAAWFEARAGQDVLETDLLRALFDDEGGLPVGLELFQRHFVAQRLLWELDDHLRTTTGQRIWIRGIRATLVGPPDLGQCGWLDPDTGLLCPQSKMLCPHRGTEHPAADSMKSYYLDPRNLGDMTDAKLEEWMEAWTRWWGQPTEALAALETLGLPADAGPDAIKARWRELSLVHHPDRGGDPEAYKKISAAWTALKSRCES